MGISNFQSEISAIENDEIVHDTKIFQNQRQFTAYRLPSNSHTVAKRTPRRTYRLKNSIVMPRTPPSSSRSFQGYAERSRSDDYRTSFSGRSKLDNWYRKTDFKQ